MTESYVGSEIGRARVCVCVCVAYVEQLIYDGTMELRVIDKPSDLEANVEVVRGGELRAHKVCPQEGAA